MRHARQQFSRACSLQIYQSGRDVCGFIKIRPLALFPRCFYRVGQVLLGRAWVLTEFSVARARVQSAACTRGVSYCTRHK